jgi:Flp pilus assembly protein TadD
MGKPRNNLIGVPGTFFGASSWPALLCSCFASLFLATGFFQGSLSQQGKVEAELGDFEQLLIQANVLLKAQHYARVLDLLSLALEQRPDDSEVKDLLKKVFALYYDNEMREGNRGIALHPEDTTFYLRLSRAYYLSGQRAKAAEILLVGTEKNPHSTELWSALAGVELQARRFGEAVALLGEVIRLDSKNSAAHHRIAAILLKMNNEKKTLKKAKKQVEQALVLEPNNPEFLGTCAEVCYRLGERQAALKLVLKAIELSPGDPYFEEQLGRYKSVKNVGANVAMPR